MDDSVILLDDSHNSVVIVEDDVEDGELDDDIVFVQPEEATRPNEDKPAGQTAQNEEIESNPSSQVSENA